MAAFRVEVRPPGPNEVRVQVSTFCVNFNDTDIVRGRWSIVPLQPPFTPGMEAMGVVESAGPGALRHLRERGLRPGDVSCVPAAAGGPKGLALLPLDRLLWREGWLPADTAVELIGASIGAWRMAALAQPDPLAAIDRLQHAYVHGQCYTAKPAPAEISTACRQIARAVYGGGSLQVRPGVTAAAHRAMELEAEPVGPVGIGQREEVTALGRSGVVHQHIQPAEPLHRRGDHGSGRGGIGEIESLNQTAIAERRGERRELIGRARDDGHAHAFRGECLRDRPADAPAGAGYDRDFPCELEIHSIRG